MQTAALPSDRFREDSFVSTAVDPINIPLNALAEAVSNQAPREPAIDKTASGIIPPVPDSIQEMGIPPAIVEHLILKYLYFRGELIGREIALQLGVQFSVIDELLETLKRQHYVGVKKSLGMGNASAVFMLTESGRNLTREYLAQSLPPTHACPAVSVPWRSGPLPALSCTENWLHRRGF